MSKRGDLYAAGGWATTDNTYREDEFYTRSVDGKGHQKHLRVNVPPVMFARMNELANDDGLPDYRTVQDVARDAIEHRLKWLQDNKGVLEEYEQAGQVSRAMSRVESLRAKTQELDNFIDQLHQGMAEAQRSLDLIRVEELTSIAATTLDSLAGDQYEQVRDIWKDGQGWLRRFREQVDKA